MKCCVLQLQRVIFCLKKAVLISPVLRVSVSLGNLALCLFQACLCSCSLKQVHFFYVHTHRAALAQMSGLIPKNEREPDSVPFHATGVSLVLHPLNPHIPTIHMNLRYFEVQSPLLPLSSAAVTSLWWFGGGIDLTPYYPDVYQVTLHFAMATTIFKSLTFIMVCLFSVAPHTQVIQFHRHLADICERHGQPYAEYKEHCDSYFYLKHRHEMRGVGGIFFDHLTEKVSTKSALLNFVRDVGFSFTELYAPFLVHRMKSYTVAQRDFQLHRRSRYVEFNLLWDRGTKFGIESEGRTESILMSLPTVAKWTYNWHPAPDSVEAHISEFFFQPGKDWLHLDPTPYLKSIEQLAQ
jgi:coproporphyrinogen III oxidase